jgi:hypothetical protein
VTPEERKALGLPRWPVPQLPDHIPAALVVLAVMGFWVTFGLLLWASYDECAARHGTLVEGVLWWECVEAKP